MREFVQALIICQRNDVASYICNWQWEWLFKSVKWEPMWNGSPTRQLGHLWRWIWLTAMYHLKLDASAGIATAIINFYGSCSYWRWALGKDEVDQYQKLILHVRGLCQQRHKHQAARQNQFHDSKCHKNLDGHWKMFGKSRRPFVIIFKLCYLLPIQLLDYSLLLD